MTTAKDLVDAIQSGKSATIQATFNSLMTEKIQDGIEAYRQAVIDNTFNPELVSESLDESFVVYKHDGQTNAIKKRFATNAAAKKHAEKLGGDHKVASSEFWHDKLNPTRVKNESELDEDFDLSEYSLEEIQEFMESEDFATLDELSKTTLKSYAKKSMDQGMQHAYIAGGGTGSEKNGDFKAALKRQRGVNTAIKKLAKD